MPPKVKVEKGVKVKKEKVAIKKELADSSSRTGVRTTKLWDSKTHYRHQVGFLDEVVSPPWKICFGALGTGIIGVVPEEKSSATSSSSSAKRVKAEPDDSEVPSRIPPGATVVLLLNAANCSLQGRNGVAMGGYGDTLDVENRSLHWKSQRSDRGRVIGAIVSHQQKGGRLLVGVRATIASAAASVSEDGAKFKLLGRVSHIDNVQESRFLVEEGSFVICDGAKLHKCIGPSCLDAGLKAGIGLQPRRYPLPEKDRKDYKFCGACCYAEANAKLHFDVLNEEGVHTYTRLPQQSKGKKRRLGNVKKEPNGSSSPRKRLRFKQEAPEWHAVKLERSDSPERPQAKGVYTLGQRVQRRDKERDWAFGYVTSLDPLEVTAKEDTSANGYQWDEVRHVPKGATAKKGLAAKVKGLLGRMQVASSRKGRGRGRGRGRGGSCDKADSSSKPAPSETEAAMPKAAAEACSLPTMATQEASVNKDADHDEVEIIDVKGCPPLPVPAADDGVVGIDAE